MGSLKNSKPRKLKTLTTILFLSTLNLTQLHSRSLVQSEFLPFTATSPSSSLISRSQSQSIISFNCTLQNDRVWLNWTVDKNQDAYQFEVEKSSDGVNFKMAALVFGTDKPETDHYQFYEKAKSTKTYYRLRIVYNDNTIKYSEIITFQATKNASK